LDEGLLFDFGLGRLGTAGVFSVVDEILDGPIIYASSQRQKKQAE